jgi:7-cyano-7-deazaguanine synthase
MKDNTVSSGSEVVAILHSGGLDSTALLGWILSSGDIPFIINIDYGAANNIAERRAVGNIIRWYEDRAFNIRDVALEISNSVMFAEQVSKEMPDATFDEMGEDNQTIFPGRNALLISMAASAALARNINVLVAGMASHDQEANFPDCSETFISAMRETLAEGYGLRFRTPFWIRSRAEVIRASYEHKVPLHLSYSCYRGGPTHCGKCPTCYSRRQSFVDAGFSDPTTYAHMPPEASETKLEVWDVQDW